MTPWLCRELTHLTVTIVYDGAVGEERGSTLAAPVDGRRRSGAGAGAGEAAVRQQQRVRQRRQTSDVWKRRETHGLSADTMMTDGMTL